MTSAIRASKPVYIADPEAPCYRVVVYTVDAEIVIDTLLESRAVELGALVVAAIEASR